jgi:hypothetical protein
MNPDSCPNQDDRCIECDAVLYADDDACTHCGAPTDEGLAVARTTVKLSLHEAALAVEMRMHDWAHDPDFVGGYRRIGEGDLPAPAPPLDPTCEFCGTRNPYVKPVEGVRCCLSCVIDLGEWDAYRAA